MDTVVALDMDIEKVGAAIEREASAPAGSG